VSCNPLLAVLNESRASGEDPETGLLKMLMVAQMSQSPACLLLAATWYAYRGPPTWDSLRQFARDFAADPDHAYHMEALAEGHVRVLSTLTAEQRKAVEPFLESS
jgi:hypothetical protein